MVDLKQIGEFGFIDRAASRLKFRSKRVRNGIGDDCAVFSCPGGKHQVISTDALVENVHFKLSMTTPRQLGRKVLSVNISDIAAMGAKPYLAVISLGIPSSVTTSFLDSFYDGLNDICGTYEIELAGGDTVSSPDHLFINVTILGEAKPNRLFLRQGSRPGDQICVTGTLGDSSLGLKLLSSPGRNWEGSARMLTYLKRQHLEPAPRLAESRRIANSTVRVSAMIDLSDGLVQDLKHICDSDNVGAVLYENQLPRSNALNRICKLNHFNPLDFILGGGEDYELLFTLNPEDVKKLYRQFRKTPTPVTLIGEITPAQGEIVMDHPGGRRLTLNKSLGFDHFRTRTRS